MQFEDSRANTDRGLYGGIIYWCDKCNYEYNESYWRIWKMVLEQKPFIKYREGPSIDTISLRLNPQERNQLEIDKKFIQQPKDSTAIKLIYKIGSNVLHDKKTKQIIDTIFKNKRNNERLGINDFD